MTIDYAKEHLILLLTRPEAEHLTEKSLDKLIAIKCSMNKGLPPELVIAFPHIKLNAIITVAEPVERCAGTIYASHTTNQILDPN